VAGTELLPEGQLPGEGLRMSIAEVRRKLKLAQANLYHYRRLADHPNLSFWARLAARNSAISHQAAAQLYQKALDYELRKEQAAS
jgi:chorismate-pyruvate lyase